MKIVDENYSFDEFEGFAPMDFSTRICLRGRIELSVFEGKIGFNREARDVLFARKFIRFAYNAEKRQLLAVSVPNEGKDTIRITSTAKAYISCAEICRLLEQECRYDLSMVRMRIPGTQSRTKKNAVIFDLTQATTAKPTRKGGRKKNGSN